MKLDSVIILLVMFRIIKYVLNKIIGAKDESKRNKYQENKKNEQQ